MKIPSENPDASWCRPRESDIEDDFATARGIMCALAISAAIYAVAVYICAFHITSAVGVVP
jgi:hypothetical protein